MSFLHSARKGKYPSFAHSGKTSVFDIRQNDLVSDRYAPAEFTVRRDKIRQREISLLGLPAQLSLALFYSSHKDAILYHVSRDRASLRHPARANSPGKHLRGRTRSRIGGEAITVETTGRKLGTYNSYFVYERYAFVGQFYDSKRWHALEAHWNFMRRLDIANCFKSIYTHSVAWSTGTDSHSKNHIKARNDIEDMDIGRAFDKIMQISNWGETNGICIGPEASRIFAEIIFQKIDSEIRARLDGLLNSGGKYEYLRYVDDYFIFTNDQQVLNQVASVIEETLRIHGFSLNPIKTKDYTTPFTTNISAKKATLKTFLKQSLPYKGKLPDYDSREIGVHLKSLLIESENDSATVGSSLSYIERRLKKFTLKRASKCKKLADATEFLDYSWSFIHNSLYQYLSHPSVASAMKMIRILRTFFKIPDLFDMPDRDVQILRFKVQEYCHFAISRAIKRLLDAENTEVEICHFLSLASACDIDLSSRESLVKDIIFKIKSSLDDRRFPRSNQASVFLMFSVIKYHMKFTETTPETKRLILETCEQLADYLLDLDFVPKRYIRSHAAQELFVIGVVTCPYLDTQDVIGILDRPWLEQLLTTTVHGVDATNTTFTDFLRRCHADSKKVETNVTMFSWTDEEFDGVLYEKEPQFVY